MAATFADLESKYDSFYAPSYQIAIDGDGTFSTAQGRASSISVTTKMGSRANRVSFGVAGVYDEAKGDFRTKELQELGLSVDTRLTVDLGYGSATTTVLKGSITDLKPTFPEGDAPTITVVGHGHRHEMDRKREDESWSDTSVKQAAEEVAGRYPFGSVNPAAEGPPGGGGSELTLKRLYKDAKTDLDFLTDLSEKFDFEMFARGGDFYFRRPAKSSPTLSLEYGKGLRTFRTGAGDNETQPKETKYRGMDPSTGETVEGSHQRQAGGDGTKRANGPAESSAEASRRAEAMATKMNRVRDSTVVTLGLPDLRIGDWIELTGIGGIGEGESFDGLYFVKQVTHRIDESGFTTEATVTDHRKE